MRKLADLIFQRDRLREELSKIEKEISVLTQKTPSLNLPFAKDGETSLPNDGNPSTIRKRPDILRFASNAPVSAEDHIPSAKIAPISDTNRSQQKI